MKNILFLLIVPFLLLSCSNTKKEIATETVTDFLKNYVNNPDSFNIDYLSVELDTVPFYLNSNILSAAEAYSKALKACSSFDDDFYSEAALVLSKWGELKNLCLSEKQGNSHVQYVALAKCSCINYWGISLKSKVIVIVDKDNPKKVLDQFVVDDDFFGKYKCIYKAIYGDFNIPHNQFWNFETVGLPRVDKFIIGQ